ncbi:MAG: DUF4430 domain-containing protein [Lachnospiraceae bacterium]
MKYKKKIMVLLLAFMMIATMLPITAMAEEVSPDIQVGAPTITSLKIVNTSDGNKECPEANNEVIILDNLTQQKVKFNLTWENADKVEATYIPDGQDEGATQEIIKQGTDLMIIKFGNLNNKVTGGTFKFTPYNGTVAGEPIVKKVKRAATLSSLDIKINDSLVAITPQFKASSSENNYEICIPTTGIMKITPKLSKQLSTHKIEINGNSVTAGNESNIDVNTLQDNGIISIVVSSANKGTDNSVSTTYKLKVHKVSENKPIFSTQPKSAAYFTDAVSAKELSVIATPQASEGASLSYQWYMNSVDSNTNGTLIENEVNSTYTPTVQGKGNNDTYYYCSVTNTNGNEKEIATSNTALIRVRSIESFSVTENDGSTLKDEYNYKVGDQACTLVGNIPNCPSDVNITYTMMRKGSQNEEYKFAHNGEKFTPPTNKEGAFFYKFEASALINTNGEVVSKKLESAEFKVTTISDKDAIVVTEYEPKDSLYYLGATNIADLDVRFSVEQDQGRYATYETQWYESSDNKTFKPTGKKQTLMKSTLKIVAPDSAKSLYYYCECMAELTSINGKKYSGTKKSKTVEIKFIDSQIEGMTGNGSKTDPFIITTTEQNSKVSELSSKSNFSEKYFKLGNDITLPNNWEPIGSDKLAFEGKFDGNGKTVTVPEGSKPLFGRVRNCTIKNLNIYGTKIAGTGLVNRYILDSEQRDIVTIENVTLKKGSQTLESGFIGGFASGINTVNMRNCTVEEGVVIGYDKTQSNIGSFGGDFNGTMTNCKSAATVYGKNFVGGICGSKGQAMGKYEINGCTFTGNVEASGDYVGGISGSGYAETIQNNKGSLSFSGFNSAPNAPAATIKNCLSVGIISGNDYVGGILGGEGGVLECWANGIGYIQNNLFKGNVTATGGNVGGVIGYLRSLNRYTVISNNYCIDTCGAQAIGKINNEYINRPEYDMVHDSVDLTTSRFGRTDDPLGKDKEKMAKSFNTNNLKETVTMLNQGQNSSKQWGEDGSLGQGKSIIALNIVGLKDNYKGGSNLDKNNINTTAVYSDGTSETLSMKNVEISGFDSSVKRYITLTFNYQNYVAYKEVQITSNATDAGKEMSVTFSLLGDTVHDKEHIHTLKGGGLVTWIPATKYVIEVGDTVLDVFKNALRKAGISWINKGGNYITSITNDTITLAEFTNGKYSGWMYNLNGTHPSLGVSEQVIHNGDTIVFHYTDDYTKEQGSEAWAPPEEDKGNSTTTNAPATIKDGVATSALDKTGMDKLVEEALKKEATTIKIELTNTGKTDTIRLQLPTQSLLDIVAKTKSNVVISTPLGDIILDQKALKELAGQAQGATIEITITKVDATTKELEDIVGDNAYILDIVITSNGKPISQLNGGEARIKVEVPANLNGKDLVAVYINDDKKLELVQGKQIKKDGKVYYQINALHLSKYALVEKAIAEKTIATQDTTPVDKNAKLTKGVKATKITSLKAKASKSKVIVTWKKSKGYKVDGYQIYKSTKKTTDFKKMTTKTNRRYVNTKSLKSGKTYFYKVRGYRVIDGKIVYTKWGKVRVKVK